MPGFPKPNIHFNYNPVNEIVALRQYRDTMPGRAIPPKQGDRLLVATWNIANLGVHVRRVEDHQLLAEIISWFDIVALQEVNDALSGLRAVQQHLPNTYAAFFSDKAGNNERMTYVYDNAKVKLMEKAGEISVPPKDIRHIRITGINMPFTGFDRNPFLVAFHAGNLRFLLVNAHLYFGKDKQADRDRRSLEAYATARWADLRKNSANAYSDKIIALGDFNIPLVVPGDQVYDALRKRGLRRPEHSTRVASNITNDKNYDQIMFFPGQMKQDHTGKIGIFDFDGAVFQALWNQLIQNHGAGNGKKRFRTYLRYYLSDHRPLWAEFRIN